MSDKSSKAGSGSDLPRTWTPISKHTSNNTTVTNPNLKKQKATGEKRSIEDFAMERELGHGAFGMVYLAKHISSGKYCALKQLDKSVIKKLRKDEHAKTEKKILTTGDSPYLLKAVCTFQDQQLAWLALEYCPGGDLKQFLEAIECFEEQEAVLYFAEMIMGVYELHRLGYIHRDLKPANFLIDKSGHIKLADFGLAKSVNAVGQARPPEEAVAISPEELEKRKQQVWKRHTKYETTFTLSSENIQDHFQTPSNMKGRLSRIKRRKVTINAIEIPGKNELRRHYGHSIVGSPEYMSPEVTEGRHQGGSYYGVEVDWWSLGCVFFEMIFGAPPFQGDTVEELFSQIDLWAKKLPVIFEENKEHVSESCFKLLTGFLCDPNQRLGKDIDKIKAQEFFKGLNWSNLLKMKPPFVPQTPPEMSYLLK